MAVDTPRAQIELGAPRSGGEIAFLVVCGVGTGAIGAYALVGAISGMGADGGVSAVLWLVAVGGFGLGLLWVVVRPSSVLFGLSDRLLAGPDGVWAGAGGGTFSAWSEITGFEVVAGRRSDDATGVMCLHDGRRIVLHALRDDVSGLSSSAHSTAAEDGVRTLNRMLAEARADPPLASSHPWEMVLKAFVVEHYEQVTPTARFGCYLGLIG